MRAMFETAATFKGEILYWQDEPLEMQRMVLLPNIGNTIQM